jgi:ATP adenylyltransferase
LCSVIQKEAGVDNFLIWQNDLIAVSANLYPYNAGHLLIFPIRHMTDYRDLNSAEMQTLGEVTKASLDILDLVYEPAGFNVGFNIGDASGASIPHLHQHVVPRYPRELGFVDIVGGAKIIIEAPSVTLARLREAFADQKR